MDPISDIASLRDWFLDLWPWKSDLRHWSALTAIVLAVCVGAIVSFIWKKGHKMANKNTAVGHETVVLGTLPDGANIGNRSVVINLADQNGNTIINRGGLAIGAGAQADPTSIAIGTGANAGKKDDRL